ncbi:hypothetical protein SMD44_p10250 (plasmid) [Streptomyces alboflavus]|uniref:Uncharacterized protein n=1 Tax=Streptomyces alboflavus TaxID=67267 RepID=A0A291W5A0_9ACTN|nr:hypothetical protein SMD44_p10250 [Streptomyces alboflavus]
MIGSTVFFSAGQFGELGKLHIPRGRAAEFCELAGHCFSQHIIGAAIVETLEDPILQIAVLKLVGEQRCQSCTPY